MRALGAVSARRRCRPREENRDCIPASLMIERAIELADFPETIADPTNSLLNATGRVGIEIMFLYGSRRSLHETRKNVLAIPEFWVKR